MHKDQPKQEVKPTSVKTIKAKAPVQIPTTTVEVNSYSLLNRAFVLSIDSGKKSAKGEDTIRAIFHGTQREITCTVNEFFKRDLK